MQQLETMEKQSPVFIFSENGTGIYMLFVDQSHPSDHDLLVTDYVGRFTTAENAMTWYDQQYLPAGEPQALIAKFDGDDINIVYRSIVLGEIGEATGHPAWAHAYDDTD